MLNNLKKNTFYVVTEDFMFTSFQDISFKIGDIIYILDVVNRSILIDDEHNMETDINFIHNFKVSFASYCWKHSQLDLFKEII